MNDAGTAPAGLAPLRGIHHLKFEVSDLDRSLHFYELALNASRIPDADPASRLTRIPGWMTRAHRK
jgi:hypothetical protein